MKQEIENQSDTETMEKRIGRQIKLLSSIIMAIIMLSSLIGGLSLIGLGMSLPNYKALLIICGIILIIVGTFSALIPAMPLFGLGTVITDAQKIDEKTDKILKKIDELSSAPKN